MKKNILLGISGGIAAYKMVEVVSRLVKKGYEVDVIMTESANNFVGPVTFESLTGNPVATSTFSSGQSADIQHISLAKKADIVLVSPATANIIAKMTHGLADDLLSTTLVATTAPVLVAPAMNVNMYNNPVVQDNLSQLKAWGFRIITPGSGYLACGDQGSGRMPEPFILVEHIIKELTENSLQGNRVLITAGPTREPLDPVRYLSNFASGKMGYALARSAAYHGGEVTLVSG
ncbi:MAG: bifunctional phosphopantothenoylcysteine decarboxylase/phosphopantothenate--cysteine ligase CoaBC, partial [Bacillota bacterium]